MNRAPAFQFYPADWLDFKVQRMSFAAQGAYMKVLCFMWKDSQDQCSIVDNDEMISKALGTSVETWQRLRAEIQNEIAPVFLIENGKIISKRLREEAKKQRKHRILRSKAGKISAQQKLNKRSTHVEHKGNSPSSSSTPSSSSSSLQKKKRLKHRLPENFAVSDSVREWARAEGLPDPGLELNHFRDHHTAHGSLFADWDAALRNWLRRSRNFGGKTNGKPQGKFDQIKQSMKDFVGDEA